MQCDTKSLIIAWHLLKVCMSCICLVCFYCYEYLYVSSLYNFLFCGQSRCNGSNTGSHSMSVHELAFSSVVINVAPVVVHFVQSPRIDNIVTYHDVIIKDEIVCDVQFRYALLLLLLLSSSIEHRSPKGHKCTKGQLFYAQVDPRVN